MVPRRSFWWGAGGSCWGIRPAVLMMQHGESAALPKEGTGTGQRNRRRGQRVHRQLCLTVWRGLWGEDTETGHWSREAQRRDTPPITPQDKRAAFAGTITGKTDGCTLTREGHRCRLRCTATAHLFRTCHWLQVTRRRPVFPITRHRHSAAFQGDDSAAGRERRRAPPFTPYGNSAAFTKTAPKQAADRAQQQRGVTRTHDRERPSVAPGTKEARAADHALG